MKSAITELFYGALPKIETMKPSKAKLKILDTVIECDEKLTELFKENQEALVLYETFKLALDESAGEEAAAFYREGFRNGFRLALDVMEEE